MKMIYGTIENAWMESWFCQNGTALVSNSGAILLSLWQNNIVANQNEDLENIFTPKDGLALRWLEITTNTLIS